MVVGPTPSSSSSSVDEVPDDDSSASDTISPSGTGWPRVSGAEMSRRPSIRRTKMRPFMVTGNKFDVDLMRLSPTLKRPNCDACLYLDMNSYMYNRSKKNSFSFSLYVIVQTNRNFTLLDNSLIVHNHLST